MKAADALLDGLAGAGLLDGVAGAGVGRLVAVGLGAHLLGADGRPVLDDPVAFPPEVLPFSHGCTQRGWSGCGSARTGPSTG
ncbi:hypothetical protein ACWC0C_38645 [Streptomyces sp. NPDC001709]